jgi:hypothetical protein
MTDLNDIIEEALYLLESWERGADADEYVTNIWHLRQIFDVYKKSQNVESALNGLAETSRDIEPEDEDMYTKQENVYTSEECVHKNDISATADKTEISATADSKEIERLNVEVKRLQDLADYRLKLLMKMPENKPWVGLTDEEIEKIVDMNTSDDGGFDIFCDGHSIASAVMDKLKERNNG